MTVPEVVRCSDGHFQHAIYGLGPYIADYPEQVLLTCVVQGWCPRYVFAPFVAHVSHNCYCPGVLQIEQIWTVRVGDAPAITQNYW